MLTEEIGYKMEVLEDGQISAWNGRYAVTPEGRVWSFIRNRYMSPFQIPNGYLTVGITKKRGEQRVTTSIHRMVAEAYIPNPRNCNNVNHKDGNKLNNSVDNLEWCTYSENHRHAYRTGIRQSSPIQRNSVRKLRYNEALDIRKLYSQGSVTHETLSEQYGICRRGIGKLISNQTYKEI